MLITHTSADFGSLVPAVGLVKLQGNGTIAMTAGSDNPEPHRLHALHCQLRKLVDTKTVDPYRLHWVRKYCLGVASGWPALADEAAVFDYHVGRVCDITSERKFIVVLDSVGVVGPLNTE